MAALVHILRKMQATRPDACVLRPVLREEARKAIGATCLAVWIMLLQHLLRHLLSAMTGCCCLHITYTCMC